MKPFGIYPSILPTSNRRGTRPYATVAGLLGHNIYNTHTSFILPLIIFLALVTVARISSPQPPLLALSMELLTLLVDVSFQSSVLVKEEDDDI